MKAGCHRNQVSVLFPGQEVLLLETIGCVDVFSKLLIPIRKRQLPEARQSLALSP